ncbi:hypothetical protein BC830DRAFT_643459 [Chytriomyces sp. MP71]|nr:hypothetical protein BC830DRAFT_643459 [Chytriomyces sp. MP71]
MKAPPSTARRGAMGPAGARSSSSSSARLGFRATVARRGLKAVSTGSVAGANGGVAVLEALVGAVRNGEGFLRTSLIRLVLVALLPLRTGRGGTRKGKGASSVSLSESLPLPLLLLPLAEVCESLPLLSVLVASRSITGTAFGMGGFGAWGGPEGRMPECPPMNPSPSSSSSATNSSIERLPGALALKYMDSTKDVSSMTG